jgi:hypothetical protein
MRFHQVSFNEDFDGDVTTPEFDDFDFGEPTEEFVPPDPRLPHLSDATRAVIAAFFDCSVDEAVAAAHQRRWLYRRPAHWVVELDDFARSAR